MPSDHLGLEGKRMQLHPRSPLGGLVWSDIGDDTRLEDNRIFIFEAIRVQISSFLDDRMDKIASMLKLI